MFEIPAESGQELTLLEAAPPTDIAHALSIKSGQGVDKAPTRQDSGALSSNSTHDDNVEVDFDVQARQIKARERVAIRRGRVFQTRRIKRKCKYELQPLFEEHRRACDALKKKLDELEAHGKLLEDLKSVAQRFRNAQDALGPADDTLERLEDRLDEEEADLEEEEDHFYRHNVILPIPAQESQLDESQLDNSLSPLAKPYVLPDASIQDVSLEPDLVQRFLDKRKEAEGLKEDLIEMDEDYYRHIQEANFRRRHNIPLSEEASDFLLNYQKLYKDVVADLNNAEEVLFQLREECRKQDLFGEFDHVYEQRDPLSQDIWDSVDDVLDRSPLRVAAQRVDYFEHETNFDDKRGYVNAWLLDWVQDSSLDVLSLRAWIYLKYPNISSKSEELLEDDKWSGLALMYWNTDAAGMETEANYKASKMDAIAGDDTLRPSTEPSPFTEAPHSLHVSHDGRRSLEEIIMGSETASYGTRRAGTSVPTTTKIQRSNSADMISLQPGVLARTEPIILQSSSSKASEDELERTRNLSFSHMTPSGDPSTLQRSLSSQDFKFSGKDFVFRRK